MLFNPPNAIITSLSGPISITGGLTIPAATTSAWILQDTNAISYYTINTVTGATSLVSTGPFTVTMPNNTASAYVVRDVSLNGYWATDTRTTVSGISAHSLDCADQTIAAVAGTTFRQVTNLPFNLNLTGTATVTALNGVGAGFQPPALAGPATIGVTTASTVSITSGPTVSGGMTVTNNYALDVLSGLSHFGGNIGVGASAGLNQAINISSALTGGSAQDGIFGTFTADGTQTNELVLMKLTCTSVSANANTLARTGGVNIGGIPAGVGQTSTLTVAYSWDGGTMGGGTYVQVNGCSVGSDSGLASVTVTGGDFIGFKLNSWAVTGSGTSHYYGMRIIAPTLATLTQSYGIQVGIITGSTVGNTVNDFAMQTLGGAVQHTVTGTIHAGTASTWDGFAIPASTLTLTAGSDDTQTNPGVNLATLYQPTITCATARSVTLASTLTIQGGPLQAGAGPATLIGTRLLNLATTGSTIANVAGSTYYVMNVNAHTLTVSAQTQMTTVPAVAALQLGQITINQTGGAVTVNEAATLYIANAPINGASVTLTNAYAFHIAAGAVQISASGAASTITSASQNLTISTTTSGTLAVNSVGLLNLTGVGASAWSAGAGSTLSAGSLTLSTASAPATTYPIVTTDNLLVFNSAGGSFTATLPTAVGVTGKMYFLKAPNGTTHAVTIATTASQTIDGASTVSLGVSNNAIIVMSDGANWQVVGQVATTIL